MATLSKIKYQQFTQKNHILIISSLYLREESLVFDKYYTNSVLPQFYYHFIFSKAFKYSHNQSEKCK